MRGEPVRTRKKWTGACAHASPGAGLGDRNGLSEWERVLDQLDSRGHYLDPFLGDIKRRAHLNLVARWAGADNSSRLLKTDLFEEAGGLDALMPDLADHAHTAIGIDRSVSITARAAKHDPRRRGCYVVADVRRLPFASESLDLVVSTSTLDHFQDPADLERSLRELRDAMAQAARLIVTLDNRQNLFDPLLRLAVRCGWAPYPMGRSYSVDELRRELEAAGLEVITTTAILHNPRLVAVAAVTLTRRLGWRWLTRLVHRTLEGAQRFERTRWRYRMGSFVAALATPRPAFDADDSNGDRRASGAAGPVGR